jgi:hypothetical protein
LHPTPPPVIWPAAFLCLLLTGVVVHLANIRLSLLSFGVAEQGCDNDHVDAR